MGLGPPFVDTLVRERAYRPLHGKVILIGRQTIYLPLARILALLREHGLDVRGIVEGDIEIDRNTLNRAPEFVDAELISDRALFRLLGAPNISALDHSDYEGADIIHDLTRPIPSDLRASADFIVDGSTLDNVFDPAAVIRNFAEMLRPGGRLLMTNTYSNHAEPYNMLPPLWFLDYFVVNGFADCKVYILVQSDPWNIFTIDIDALLDPSRGVSAVVSPHWMASHVLAETGERSTSHVNAVQQQYRSEEDWAAYRKNLQRIKANPRPHIARSWGNISHFDVRGGHLFMANDFTARDVSTEIRKLNPAGR